MGIKKGVDVVICGHIHQPRMEKIESEDGTILYMNSGDWIENMTALEYVAGKWSLFKYGMQADSNLEEYLTKLEADQYIFPSGKRTIEEGEKI